MIQRIEALKSGDIYTSPLFLATSILKKIALNWAAHDIVLEIIIEPKDFHKVPYTYLGNTVEDIGNVEYFESEMLLNLFSQLKFVKKYIKNETFDTETSRVKINSKGDIEPILEKKTNSYTFYRFKWIDNPHYNNVELENGLTESMEILNAIIEQPKLKVVSPRMTRSRAKKGGKINKTKRKRS